MSLARKWIYAAIALVAVGTIIYSCVFTIHETQKGVLTTFGKIQLPLREPGLHFKWPAPISKVYKVDLRTQTLTGMPVELITNDQQNILVDGYLFWRISDPVLFIEAVRTKQSAEERLADLYFSTIGIVVSNKSRENFISLGLLHGDLQRTTKEIYDRIAPITVKNYGIELLQAGIVEYTLPTENRASVIQRMISERARLAARYRSEGEEAAIRIEALAVSEHEKIVGDAHAEATRILGKAEATAMAELGKAYSKDPEFYKFIRALDSYDLIIDEQTTLILPTENELFKFLDSNEIPQ